MRKKERDRGKNPPEQYTDYWLLRSSYSLVAMHSLGTEIRADGRPAVIGNGEGNSSYSIAARCVVLVRGAASCAAARASKATRLLGSEKPLNFWVWLEIICIRP